MRPADWAAFSAFFLLFLLFELALFAAAAAAVWQHWQAARVYWGYQYWHSMQFPSLPAPIMPQLLFHTLPALFILCTSYIFIHRGRKICRLRALISYASQAGHQGSGSGTSRVSCPEFLFVLRCLPVYSLKIYVVPLGCALFSQYFYYILIYFSILFAILNRKIPTEISVGKRQSMKS